MHENERAELEKQGRIQDMVQDLIIEKQRRIQDMVQDLIIEKQRRMQDMVHDLTLFPFGSPITFFRHSKKVLV